MPGGAVEALRRPALLPIDVSPSRREGGR